MTVGLQRSSRRFLSVLLAFTFAVAPIAPVVADDEEVESVAAIESEEAEFEAAHSEGCQGVVWIDLPRAGENITVPRSEVAGWALDANETFASGVDAIRVTLGRPGTPGALELASIGTGIPRPDVDTHWQRADLRAGYSAIIEWFRLPAGPQTIFVNGRTHCGWVEASVNVNIAAPPPAPPVSISIDDESGTVSDFGDRDFTFNVTLSQASTQTVTVQYRTEDGSAGSGDYSPTSGTLTFSPGGTSQTIRVRVFGRRFSDFDRELTFFVRLSNPTNATIADGEGVGRIRTSFRQRFGTVTVDSQTCPEPISGQTTTCTIRIRRSFDTDQFQSVSWQTLNSNAIGGTSCGAFDGTVDYITTSGTVSFSRFDTTRDIFVTICGDGAADTSQQFLIEVRSFDSTFGGTTTGTITISG